MLYWASQKGISAATIVAATVKSPTAQPMKTGLEYHFSGFPKIIVVFGRNHKVIILASITAPKMEKALRALR